MEVLTSTTGWPLFLVKALPPNAKIARETPAANTNSASNTASSASSVEGLGVDNRPFAIWGGGDRPQVGKKS